MRISDWSSDVCSSDLIRHTTSSDPFVFLRLFTSAQAPLPSFASILGFLIPLIAIGLGFDAINGEYSRRTMSRLLSQPIYRDALLLGTFLAGLLTLAISLICLWLDRKSTRLTSSH